MRKTISDPHQSISKASIAQDNYLNLETLAQVIVSSEAESFPIEAALTNISDAGWRAANPGEQSIRIVFDQILNINEILLVCEEHQQQRTQEFVLRWSSDNENFQEILRQQFHFSPPGTVREIENYTVNLHELKALELNIIADISNSSQVASLKQLRLA